MAVVAKFKNLDKVMAQLQAKGKEFDREAKKKVVIGYTQSYALMVHENTEAHHKPGKQAKYLEEPARRLRSELARVVVLVYKQTRSMSKGMLAAALRLLRESQEIVPVDTGALRASGYVAYASDAESAARAAQARADNLRPPK